MALGPGTAFKLLIASMLGLSVYFTLDVERRRGSLRGDVSGIDLVDGATVTVGQALDGDELSVQDGDRTFTLRLLGIKAFDVSNEPGLGDPGQRALDSLARHAGQTGVVRFPEKVVDRSGRLIARLEIGGEDVGAGLVSEGWALVFTRYPFADQEAYLALERQAREARRGLWAIPKAAERAAGLHAGWEGE